MSTSMASPPADSLHSKRFRASSSGKLGREQKKGIRGEGEGSEQPPKDVCGEATAWRLHTNLYNFG